MDEKQVDSMALGGEPSVAMKRLADVMEVAGGKLTQFQPHLGDVVGMHPTDVRRVYGRSRLQMLKRNGREQRSQRPRKPAPRGRAALLARQGKARGI